MSSNRKLRYGMIGGGRGAFIGANAVVLNDVPAGATAVGVPARIIKARSRRETRERLDMLA